MADRIPFDHEQDRERGVDRVRDMFSNFSSAHAFKIEPDGMTRTDVRNAIREIWDLTKVEATGIKRALNGPMAQADDEQLTVLICLVVIEKLSQYRSKLPSAGTP